MCREWGRLTLRNVQHHPVVHRRMRHGLEQHQALARYPVTLDNHADHLAVLLGLLHLLDEVDRLLADEHGGLAEDAPALGGLEGLHGAEGIDHVLGQGLDGADVVLLGQVVGAQVLEPRNGKGVVVAEHNLLAVGFALTGRRRLARVGRGALLPDLPETQLHRPVGGRVAPSRVGSLFGGNPGCGGRCDGEAAAATTGLEDLAGSQGHGRGAHQAPKAVGRRHGVCV